MAHPTVLIRKSVLREQKLKFDTNAYVAEDFDLWWRMAFHCKMANLPETLLEYRIHESQESSSKTDIQIENHRKSLLRFMSALQIDPLVFNPDFIAGILSNEFPFTGDLIRRTLTFFEALLNSEKAVQFFGKASILNKRNALLDRQLGNLKQYSWKNFGLMRRSEIRESIERNHINRNTWLLKSLICWKTR